MYTVAQEEIENRQTLEDFNKQVPSSPIAPSVRRARGIFSTRLVDRKKWNLSYSNWKYVLHIDGTIEGDL